MGARVNFIFRDREDRPAVVLYSHWGETQWRRDLAMALEHAKPRWDDSSYFTRMVISYLMQDDVLGETGFGIYAISDITMDLGDECVVINIADQTILNDVAVTWDNFVQAYLPVAATAGAGVTSR